MSEITASPVGVFIAPDLDYPANVAKAIKDYETVHGAWTTEYTALHAAENAVPVAAAEDARALSAAVAAGKDDPGGREVKAARTVVVANERTRQAREKATAQTDLLKAAIAEAGAALAPIIIERARSLADAYDLALADARRQVTSAAIAAQDACGSMSMVSDVLRAQYGIGTPMFSSVAQPSWPTSPCSGNMTRLDHVERAIAEARQRGLTP